MQPKMKEVEKNLRNLCNDFITILDDYRTQGIISEEEYEKHTAIKKDFLSNINE